jgi:polyvinyl alcohol dehydrogenase (cytochrome)
MRVKIWNAAGVTGLALLATMGWGSGRAKATLELAAAARSQAAENANAEALYRDHCAACHETGASRAPTRAAMGQLTADQIRYALTSGKMKTQGAELTRVQVDAMVLFLAGTAAPKAATNNTCGASAAVPADALSRPHWSGWGAGPDQHRFQPPEMAGLGANQVPRLKLKWAFGFSGVTQAYAQPAVALGRIFVGSANRKVYSLDAQTGCTYWEFAADAPVRTAATVADNGSGWAVYFGDQHATAYAVDAITGKLLWKTRLDDHPAAIITGAPTLAGGKLYVPMSSFEEVMGAGPKYECCKFRGSLSAVDAATGKILWKSYTVADEPRPVRKNKLGVQLWGPSGAAVWSSPTVDVTHHTVYVTTGDSYSDPPASTSDSFLAFDSETGKLVWSRQMTAGDAFTTDCDLPPEMQTNCPDAKGPDFDFGSSPILVDLAGGRRALIAGQKSGVVHAVDPDRHGELLWQRRVGRGGRLGGVQWGSAADSKNVYVALSDVAILGAQAGTPGAQKTMMGIPLRLDPKAGGGLFALSLDRGEVVWHTPHPGCGDAPGCSPAQSAAVTAIAGVVFSGGLDGHLRAYSAHDGRIIWDLDTKQEYAAVNGVKASGGSLDGPGPVIAAGMLYVNSGYMFLGSVPGNVLLAFSIDGK